MSGSRLRGPPGAGGMARGGWEVLLGGSHSLRCSRSGCCRSKTSKGMLLRVNVLQLQNRFDSTKNSNNDNPLAKERGDDPSARHTVKMAQSDS